ncbi:unnamed protein product, partial [marine sediment metagenome]
SGDVSSSGDRLPVGLFGVGKLPESYTCGGVPNDICRRAELH